MWLSIFILHISLPIEFLQNTFSPNWLFCYNALNVKRHSDRGFKGSRKLILSIEWMLKRKRRGAVGWWVLVMLEYILILVFFLLVSPCGIEMRNMQSSKIQNWCEMWRFLQKIHPAYWKLLFGSFHILSYEMNETYIRTLHSSLLWGSSKCLRSAIDLELFITSLLLSEQVKF